MSVNDLATVMPELLLVLLGGLLVLADAFAPALRPRFATLTAIGTMAALALRWIEPVPGVVWFGALRVDALARFADSYFLIALVLAVIIADPYLARTNARYGEFYGLLVWSTVGGMVMAKADHLLAVFVGLELLSICLYALNAFHRDSGVSLESGWKYLVVGGFSAAILLFGISLLYGASGTLTISQLEAQAAQGLTSRPLVVVALAFLLAGLAFKLALVPFHAWAPDVYQGAPTPVTAFLSVAPKGAALVVLARLVIALAPGAAVPHWTTLLATIAVASMTLGNLVAIAQRDLKRMLAYSGIAHMGYALVGITAGGADGISGVLVYMAAYTFMNIAAFAVISAFSESEDEPHLLTDLAGAGWKRPFLSFVLALAMFSLAGVPPTAGFIGKFLVFRSAVNHDMVWLAVAGVLNSLVSVFYYIRVIFYLYMKPLPKRVPKFTEPWPVRVAAALCGLGIVALGVLPGWVVAAAEAAARTLVR